MGRHQAQEPQETVAPSSDVRRAVLDGALDIIATEGANAVSMREVARRAGVSHQAPYHYFTDRAGIFAAITEEGFRKFTEVFSSRLQSSTDPLTDCFQAYVMFALEHRGHYRVMFQSDICGISTHEKARHAADDAFLALLDLAHAVDPTTSSSDDALTLPISLWATAHGLATLIMDGPLMAKVPPGTIPDELVIRVGQFFSRSIHGEINR